MEKIKLISQNKADVESIFSDWFSSYEYSDYGLFIKRIEAKNSKITIFIVEDYYFRINATLTLTLIVEETADNTTVEIVSSGGKEGVWGFSYGAEKSAIKRIAKKLKENGFAEQ